MKVSNKDISKKYLTIAKKVAKHFIVLENVASVVIGGSLARGFYDNYSDIEMYVYYDEKMPPKKDISKILVKLNSKLNRSKKIYWFHKSWGYHTFFRVDGVKIELGYRNTKEIENRMNSFLSKFSLPQHGIHDTPFGHYESGVANCILTCIPLCEKKGNNWLRQIKIKLRKYPLELKKTTTQYYYRDAKIITKIKIKNAIARDDTFLFNACLARVVRSLNICLFAFNEIYYPGDKWNHKYISKFTIIPDDYFNNMNLILSAGSVSLESKKYIYKKLSKIIYDINKLLKQNC